MIARGEIGLLVAGMGFAIGAISKNVYAIFVMRA